MPIRRCSGDAKKMPVKQSLQTMDLGLLAVILAGWLVILVAFALSLGLLGCSHGSASTEEGLSWSRSHGNEHETEP